MGVVSGLALERKEAYTARVRLWQSQSHGDGRCTAAGCTADSVLDPFHVIFDCTAPAVAKARSLVLLSLPHVAADIVSRCYEIKEVAAGLTGAALTAARQDRLATFRTIAFNTDWASHDGRWTAYRLLLCSTWSAYSVSETPDGIPCELAKAMGEAFDDVCVHHHRLRSLANMWVGWATRKVNTLVTPWAMAVEATASLPAALDGEPGEDPPGLVDDSQSVDGLSSYSGSTIAHDELFEQPL